MASLCKYSFFKFPLCATNDSANLADFFVSVATSEYECIKTLKMIDDRLLDSDDRRLAAFKKLPVQIQAYVRVSETIKISLIIVFL